MMLDSAPLDLTLASAAILLFVAPTAYHLLSDLGTRSTRDFSLIPNRPRHIVSAVVRLGIIGGTLLLAGLVSEAGGKVALWAGVLALLTTWASFAISDRRLFIDADSGRVSWRKISLPWFPSWKEPVFIDEVSPVHFDGERTMNLLDVAELQQFWTVNYNGSVSSSGHYSERHLEKIRDRVNDYLAAFRRHDSEDRRSLRERFRANLRAQRAPRLARRERRRKLAEQRMQARAERVERWLEARNKRALKARRREVDEKFAS